MDNNTYLCWFKGVKATQIQGKSISLTSWPRLASIGVRYSSSIFNRECQLRPSYLLVNLISNNWNSIWKCMLSILRSSYLFVSSCCSRWIFFCLLILEGWSLRVNLAGQRREELGRSCLSSAYPCNEATEGFDKDEQGKRKQLIWPKCRMELSYFHHSWIS